jgi:hypothetical protein
MSVASGNELSARLGAGAPVAAGVAVGAGAAVHPERVAMTAADNTAADNTAADTAARRKRR